MSAFVSSSVHRLPKMRPATGHVSGSDGDTTFGWTASASWPPPFPPSIRPTRWLTSSGERRIGSAATSGASSPRASSSSWT